MASTPTRLMTFEEFAQLPWPGDERYELRDGEMIRVPPPILGHSKIQETVRRLLDRAAAGAGTVFIELGFRPRTEREYRIADVAYTANERLARMDTNGHFEGSPELIVEVISPSNTAVEMAEKRALYLETGCLEFWVIIPKHRRVDVSTPDGRTITYKSGDQIPLMFGGALAVDAIFANS